MVAEGRKACTEAKKETWGNFDAASLLARSCRMLPPVGRLTSVLAAKHWIVSYWLQSESRSSVETTLSESVLGQSLIRPSCRAMLEES